VAAAIEALRHGGGCEESARILHDAYHDRLYRYFVSRGCSAEDARDLTQDTFLKIYRGIGTFRGDSAFGTWVWVIARNVLLKSAARGPAREATPEELPAALEPVADEPDPVVVIGNRQLRALVLRAFERLPARQRQCMVLRVVRGLSYGQVATVMSISINSVKAHLHQGRTRLQELLAPTGAGRPGGPR
jgi:RNA polymerase sigma-70 factor (ECF subfamily)